MFAAAGSPNKRMLTELRRNQIVEMVEEQGVVRSEELVGRFGVSSMTVWRDLKDLDEVGRVRKIRGGAARIERPRDSEPFFTTKQVVNQRQKEAIARYTASRFVDDQDIVFLEAGTTVAAMAKYLNKRQLTVIGNGLGTMNELSQRLGDMNVYCCGGMMRAVSNTFVGPQTEEFIRHINARTCFISATGLAFPEGITDPNPLEIQVKRAMVRSAQRVVLLIDSSKFGVRSLQRILPLEDICALVTDEHIEPQYVAMLRHLNIDLHVVTMEGERRIQVDG